jgi:uncharacterized RDD family membrane protein YckC
VVAAAGEAEGRGVSYVPSPAGFWKRFVAYFVDLVLLTVVVNFVAMGAMAVLGLVVDMAPPDPAEMLRMLDPSQPVDPMPLLEAIGPWLLLVTAVSTVAYIVVAGVYFIVTEAAPRQASFGKQLLGLRVTDTAGRPLTVRHSFWRFVAASLSWLTLNAGHALAAWTPSKRALHDFVAGTRVENADPANTAMPAWGWAIVSLFAVASLGLALMCAVAIVLVMQAGMAY